ncbi:MAG TPA: aldolase [Candidatus Dormibacteraeota bacterium]|nr:aldolase [Candidatus Dormibacteraeota bacterium]
MTDQPASGLSQDAIWQKRVDLAAALRFAHRLGFSEGICNHFSVVVPGSPNRFLLNPRGLHWSEIRASDLIVVDSSGRLIEGKYEAEPTAFYIHSRIHASKPEAKCVLHTHMPYATALCCTEGEGLAWVHQNSLRFYGRTAYDANYNGQALDKAEGNRISAALQGKNTIVFLSHHGVIVTGTAVDVAFDDLYYLERACMHQVLAQSTGLPLRIVPPAVCEKFSSQVDEIVEQARLHFEAVKRILNREEPEYAT